MNKPFVFASVQFLVCCVISFPMRQFWLFQQPVAFWALNISASALSNFWISAFTVSFLSCWYFPIENLGFLFLATDGGLKTQWFIFAKRRHKRRINTYLMNTDIELTSYHFRFFIKVHYTPKKDQRKRLPETLATVTWLFIFASYHIIFFSIYRARIYLIRHRHKANEFSNDRPNSIARTSSPKYWLKLGLFGT